MENGGLISKCNKLRIYFYPGKWFNVLYLESTGMEGRDTTFFIFQVTPLRNFLQPGWPTVLNTHFLAKIKDEKVEMRNSLTDKFI
ncbi:MAG: hypothetical protein ACTSXU_10680 [Promethearchaeota archaeon]